MFHTAEAQCTFAASTACVMPEDENATNHAAWDKFQTRLSQYNLADGEVHVTLKEGKPYSLWNLVSLAHHATQGVLTQKTTRAFDPKQFPGQITLS